ncbi:MAG: DUF3892 domain-containing protein [Candidatus Aegiribacteria sp.]|nr:DUF3892 domain-containing protein [Candidatus Aegiribacteria sp.]
MGEWADYCIVAIRYGNSRKEISHLKVRRDLSSHFGSPETWTKEETRIKITDFFRDIITMTYDGENWNKGAKVQAVRIDNNYYLRTNANSIKEDNLGELPEF